MPDSTVSRAAALVSNQLEQWLVGFLPINGQLCYGIEDSTGVGMTWHREELLPTVVLPDAKEDGWTVRVLESVARCIDVDAKKWGTFETGGALLGHVSPITRIITVAGLVDAPSDSARSESRFILGTNELVSTLRQAHQQSLGHLQFVGTWHSHPIGGPHSVLDRKTLRSIANDFAGMPAVSLVWTPSGFKCEVATW
jgi:Prokaryotic homologs of the JAB domain